MTALTAEESQKKIYARHLCDSLSCVSDELCKSVVILTTHAPEGNASL